MEARSAAVREEPEHTAPPPPPHQAASFKSSRPRKFYPDRATWWEENLSPTRRGLNGAALILLGTILHLVSALFGTADTSNIISLAGASFVAVGTILLASNGYAGLPTSIFVGLIFLALGLSGYLFCLVWLQSAGPSAAYQGDQYDATYASIVACLAFSIVGILIVAKRALEDIKKPLGGPDNYLIFGVLIFGGGALAFLLTALDAVINNPNDVSPKYDIHRNADVFGSMLFVMGSLYLFLNSYRTHYNFNGIIEQRFPATSLTSTSVVGSKLAYSGSWMQFVGCAVIACSMIFCKKPVTHMSYVGTDSVTDTVSIMPQRSRDSMVASAVGGFIAFAGLACVKLAYKLDKLAFIRCRRLPVGLALQAVGTACLTGTWMYQAGMSTDAGVDKNGKLNDNLYSGIVSGGAFLAAGAILVFMSGLKCYFPPFFNPGNYGFLLGPLLSFGSAACYVAYGVQGVRGKGFADAADTEMLAAIVQLHSALLLLLHARMAVDVNWVTTYDVPEVGDLDNDDDAADADDSVAEPDTVSEAVAAWEARNTQQKSLRLLASTPWARSRMKDNQLPAPSALPVEELLVDVIIVGAGPAGLTLANELGMRGVKTLIVEMRTEVVPDSRFFLVNSATVEGLKRLGLKDRIIEASTPTDFKFGTVLATGVTQPDAQVLGRVDGPSRAEMMALGFNAQDWQCSRNVSSKHAEEAPQRVMQSVQERILRQGAEERESVDVRYGWEMLDFRRGLNDVTALIAPIQTAETQTTAGNTAAFASSAGAGQEPDPTFSKRDGVVIVKAKYMVGADGPGSKVAAKLGIRFDGFVNLATSRSTLIHCPGLLAKIRDSHGEQLQYHIACAGVGAGYLVPSDIERELWTFHLHGLASGVPPKDVPAASLHGIIQKFLGPAVEFTIKSDGRWYWNFFFAKSFRRGRVLILGDAAHSWPPFGGVGGNTGYQDANNLGWKLAACCKGWGGDILLESFDIERRSSGLRTARFVLKLTPRPGSFMTMVKYSRHPIVGGMVIARWRYGNTGVHMANHYASDGTYLGLRYDHSPLCLRGKKDMIIPESPACEWWPAVTPGGRAPHLPLEDGTNLYEHIAHDGYTLIVTVSLDADVSNGAQSTSFRAGKNTAAVMVERLETAFRAANMPPLKVVNIADTLAHKYSGVHAEHVAMYKGCKFIIVRPDLYVLWVGRKVKNQALAARIAGAACGKVPMSRLEASESLSAAAWLRDRWLKEMQPYMIRFPQALFFKDKTKKAVLAILQQKRKAQESILSKPTEVDRKPSYASNSGAIDGAAVGGGGGGVEEGLTKPVQSSEVRMEDGEGEVVEGEESKVAEA